MRIKEWKESSPKNKGSHIKLVKCGNWEEVVLCCYVVRRGEKFGHN